MRGSIGRRITHWECQEKWRVSGKTGRRWCRRRESGIGLPHSKTWRRWLPLGWRMRPGNAGFHRSKNNSLGMPGKVESEWKDWSALVQTKGKRHRAAALQNLAEMVAFGM